MAIHVKTAMLIADRISMCISRTILIRALGSHVHSPEQKRKKIEEFCTLRNFYHCKHMVVVIKRGLLTAGVLVF